MLGDINVAEPMAQIGFAGPRTIKATIRIELPKGFQTSEFLLEHGFVDIYRRLYPERVQYTWWTYISNARARNVGWRIDYFLISEALVPKVKDIVIHDEIPGSDHCPVELILA